MKQKVTYAEFLAAQKDMKKSDEKARDGTVSWMLQFYLDRKPISVGQTYTARLLKRSPHIGPKKMSAFTHEDFIEHCEMRRRTPQLRRPNGVQAATVMQDHSFLVVAAKYVAAAPGGDKSAAQVAGAVATAKTFCVKEGLIGKSSPRKRRPTDDEIERLLAYFEAPPKRAMKNVIRAMPDMIAFGLVSTRRLGEICRITHGDINWSKRTYWVRDLKHPTKKKGNDKEFALFDELAEIIKRQPRVSADNPAERVFPFRKESVSAKYTRAKHDLGIVDLRFHDCRREAITRWLKKLPPHKVRQISGHETTVVLERVYDAPKAEDLHAELAAIEQRLAA